MRIVLGSASPRRRELLAQIGLDFEVVVSEVEERVTSFEPCEVVEELSAQKAEGVWQLLCEGCGRLLVIGADTIVSCDGRILGKPRDAEDAKAMLRLLQGRAHEVYTGVTMLYAADKSTAKADAVARENTVGRKAVTVQRCTFHEATKVFFYPMTEEEIDAYVATGDPLDKAGAYGIQGLCARYISGIEGDYNNVVGLPVGRLYQEMKEWL